MRECALSLDMYVCFVGFNKAMFIKTMHKYSLDDCSSTLLENGVDCLLTFCSMTEDEFKDCGLKKGYILKCTLAQKHIIMECRQGLTTDIETTV